MSTTLTLIQTAGTAVIGALATIPVDQVARSAASLALLGGLAVFFRPLLVGLGRAAVLAVRPRPPKILAKRP